MHCSATNENHSENVSQVTWPSLRSEAQALGWCCMCSIFLQILLIFSYVAPPGECYYNMLLCCDEYFSPSSMVSRTFSALCVYSKFRHYPHPLGYLGAKFCFFRSCRCWASPWRKIAYSLTQSLTQLIWCFGNRSLCFRIIINRIRK